LPISRVWQRAVEEYKNLFDDALQSNALFPALAAAKFLLNLGEEAAVVEFCHRLTGTSSAQQVRHWLFGNMTPEILYDVLEVAVPERLATGHVLCEIGHPADSCFLPISGRLAVSVPNDSTTRWVQDDSIVGEFGLWVPNCRRTAKVTANTECLILKFRYRDFQDILSRAPHVNEMLKAGIKRKINENICSSAYYFPLPEDRRKIVKQVAECNEHRVGDELDLTKYTYFLFSGEAELVEPAEGSRLRVAAHANFSDMPVLGVRTKRMSCDGPVARVLAHSVTMRVPTDVMTQIQKDKYCAARWAQIWGARCHELSEQETEDASSPSRQADRL
jgi:CRP-like cAMP-binding protein